MSLGIEAPCAGAFKGTHMNDGTSDGLTRKPRPLPKISIGLPVYNGEQFLSAAVESVLGQTHQDFELIISDNCSTDSTWSICLQYGAQDDRVRLNRNERNEGMIANWDHVVRLSRAEYFMWMAHDDKLSPDLLAACYEFLRSHDEYVACCGRTVRIDETDAILNVLTGFNGAEQPSPGARYLECLADIRSCHTIYGLIRRRALVPAWNALCAGRPDASMDRRLVCALSMYGRIKQLEEVERYYRFHPDQVHHATVDIARFWKNHCGPSCKPPLMPWANNTLNHVKQIRRSDMGPRDKIRAIMGVLADLTPRKLKLDVVHCGAALSRNRPGLNRALKSVWHRVRQSPARNV